MSRIDELRAEAQKLYEEAARIKCGEDRLVVIFRAMELETEADSLQYQNASAHQPQPRDHD